MRTLFTDEWSLIGTIDPDKVVSSPASNQLTDAIDMADYDQVAFVFAFGNMDGAADTVTCSVVQSDASGGTYKAVTNASATALTGSPNQDDSQVIITVDEHALDMDNDYRYVKGQVALAGGTTGTDITVMAFGRAKHKPASDADLSSVAEIVNV